MNLWIVEWLGDGLWEKLPQPHLDILSSGTILQQQWTVWKSTWKIFGDTKSEGICFTIIGGSFWRWLHPGSLVEYPTVPGGMGQINRVQKDPYSNDQKKMLRIYSTQSKGWLFWRTNTIVELLNLKLQSDRFIFLTVCLRRTPPGRDPLGAGGVGKSEKSAQKWLFVAMHQSHHCGGLLDVYILVESMIAHNVPCLQCWQRRTTMAVQRLFPACLFDR